MDHLEPVCEWFCCSSDRGCGLPHSRSSTLCPLISRTGEGSPGADSGQGVLGSILVPKPNPVLYPCLLPSRTTLQACVEVDAQNSQNPGKLHRLTIGGFLASMGTNESHHQPLPQSHSVGKPNTLFPGVRKPGTPAYSRSAAGSGDTFSGPQNHLTRILLPFGVWLKAAFTAPTLS